MKEFTKEELDKFDRLYRINLVNSLSGFKSANLIGTKSESGQENLAVFSSVVHLGSNPALFGFVLRPNSVPRHTYTNLKQTGKYTINHIALNFYEGAHHTSAKYKEDISEFDQSNLTPEYLSKFHAPFVKESPIKLALNFVEEYFIKANETIMVVGEIEFFQVQEDLISEDGFVDLSRANIATINGLDGYAFPKLKSRQGYQRPKK